jgi:hypothetical protein
MLSTIRTCTWTYEALELAMDVVDNGHIPYGRQVRHGTFQ